MEIKTLHNFIYSNSIVKKTFCLLLVLGGYLCSSAQTGAPVIFNPQGQTLTYNLGTPSFFFNVQATNSPTSYTFTGIPTGIGLTGYTYGQIVEVGGQITNCAAMFQPPVKINYTATNASGTATGYFYLMVLPPVYQAQSFSATLSVGAPTRTLIAIISPSGIGYTALPQGLNLVITSNFSIPQPIDSIFLEGTPTTSGSSSLSLSFSPGPCVNNTLNIPITINPAGVPSPTSATITDTLNTPFSYQIVATNSPTSYHLAGQPLPIGVSLDTLTGIISGTSIIQGIITDTVKVTNVLGTGIGIISISSNYATPVITSATSINSVQSSDFSYQITATHSPLYYTLIGSLPPGTSMYFNPSTGQITGIPTTVGSYTVNYSVTNIGGTINGSVVINVTPASLPVMFPGTTTGTVGIPFYYFAGYTTTFLNRFDYTPTDTVTHSTLNWIQLHDTTIGGGSGVVLVGMPTTPGTYNATITAYNFVGTSTGTLVIIINPAAKPAIISNKQIGSTGSSFVDTVKATNFPTSYTATGLPPGLNINTTTGIINGTPTLAAGGNNYIATISATNILGTGTGVDTIFITPPAPVVTSAKQIDNINTAFNYATIATNNPTKYIAAGLPAGLSIDTTSGIISGVPSAIGSYLSIITAINAGGSGTAFDTINVLPAKPVLTLVAPYDTAEIPFSYQIVATGNPTSYSATGLPGGPLGLTLNSSTGVISGTTLGSGDYPITITATNAGGTTTGTLIIHMMYTAIPSLGPNVMHITVGVNIPDLPADYVAEAREGSHMLSYNFSPALTFPVQGEFQAEEGIGYTVLSIGGEDDVPNSNYNGTLTITSVLNSGGPIVTTTEPFTIIVDPALPTIATATQTGTIGTSFNYTIAATSSPANYTATGLPPGLSVNTSTGLIHGTPTLVGIYLVTVTATNTTGTGTGIDSIIVNMVLPSQPVITTVTQAATTGTSFNYTIAATNNPTSYTATGLPTGLNVNALTGAVTGTPSTAGTYPVNVSATNAGGTSTGIDTIKVIAPLPPQPVITIGTQTGTVGTAFNYAIVATNNPTGYTATGLPAGLNVNISSGLISGTSTLIGTFTVAITATNAGGTGTGIDTIKIIAPLPPPPIITTATSTGMVGTTFNYTIAATNSPTAYTATGLPSGLNVNASTGIITGMPTTAGTYPVAVSATNIGGTGIGTDTIKINNIPLPPQPVITTATIPGVVGTIFSYRITATNTPTSYTATDLPTGLNINLSTGVITGTPTTVGIYPVYITAINAGGTATGTDSIKITAPIPQRPVLTIVTQTGETGALFTYAITATNNPTNYTATGLPAGLSINPATGVISGTPVTVATSTVSISAGNVAGTAIGILTLIITGPIPMVASSGMRGSIGNVFGYYAIIATNNPTSYNATGLPPGLSINTTTGVISGTPTTDGVFQVTISATNAIGTGTGTLGILITIPPPVIYAAPITWTVNKPFFNLAINATNNPTSFSATDLPPGMSIDVSTGVISGTPTTVGIYNTIIIATNREASGTGTQTFIIDAASDAVLWPNPVTQNNLIVSIPDWNGGSLVNAEILDYEGSVIQNQYNQPIDNSNYFHLNLPNLVAGQYILVITGAQGKIVKQFIVQ